MLTKFVCSILILTFIGKSEPGRHRELQSRSLQDREGFENLFDNTEQRIIDAVARGLTFIRGDGPTARVIRSGGGRRRLGSRSLTASGSMALQTFVATVTASLTQIAEELEQDAEQIVNDFKTFEDGIVALGTPITFDQVLTFESAQDQGILDLRDIRLHALIAVLVLRGESLTTFDALS